MIVLSTVNPHSRLDKQFEALLTWCEYDLRLINSRDEIDLIEEYVNKNNIDIELKFIEVCKDNDMIKKKYVKLSSIINIINNINDCEKFCIVNSDIFYDGKYDLDSLNDDMLHLGVRYEFFNEKYELFPYGFDVFIFNKKLLPNILISDELGIGMPWWDYYFPLVFIYNRIKVNIIQKKYAFVHHTHETAYIFNDWCTIGDVFRRLAYELGFDRHTDKSLQEYAMRTKIFIDNISTVAKIKVFD